MPPLPRKGAFAVLSIDSFCSLADFYGDGIHSICEGMEDKKYVANVDSAFFTGHFEHPRTLNWSLFRRTICLLDPPPPIVLKPDVRLILRFK